MNPAMATAAWTAGDLMETSIKQAPSSLRHNSAVMRQGQAGSMNPQQMRLQGAVHSQGVEFNLLAPHCGQKLNLLLAKQAPIPFLPAATHLISPFSTGMVSDADLTTPFSLASASSLTPSNLIQSFKTSLGTSSRDGAPHSGLQSHPRDEHHRHQAAPRSHQGLRLANTIPASPPLANSPDRVFTRPRPRADHVITRNIE